MNSTLQKHIEEINCRNHNSATFSGNVPATLNRWLVTCVYSVAANPLDTEPLLDSKAVILMREDLNTMPPNSIDTNWQFYVSTNSDDYYSSNFIEPVFLSRKDKTIYCTNTIYCHKDELILFTVNAITPISMWIDGKLVLKNHFLFIQRPYPIFVKLKKGCHYILIEKVALRKNFSSPAFNNYFFITIKPFNLFLKKSPFIDQKEFKKYKKYLNIVTDKIIHTTDDPVQFLAVSGTPLVESRVLIQVYNRQRELVYKKEVSPSTPTTIDELGGQSGLFYIYANTIDARSAGELIIFKGAFEESLNALARQAQVRSDCSDDILYQFNCLKTLINFETGLYMNSYEIMMPGAYKLLLEKYADFLQYTETKAASKQVKLENIFKRDILYFQKSFIDDEYTTGWLQIPVNYIPQRSFPLLLYISFGAGGSRLSYLIPFLEYLELKNAFVLNITGRGSTISDFFHESGILKILNRVLNEFNIDINRISTLGSCAGGFLAVGLGIHYPDLFSAIGCMDSTVRMDLRNPDYSYCGNLSNTLFYSLNNIEDYAISTARALNTNKHFPRLKEINLDQFLHIDYTQWLCSGKLLNRLFKEKRNLFPRKIYFKLERPYYNKSFWLYISKIDDLQKDTVVNAIIQNSSTILLEPDNVASMILLVDRKKMGLKKQINIKMREHTVSISLGDFNFVYLAWTGGEWKVTVEQVSRLHFIQKYNHRELKPALFGIKEIYLDRCELIRAPYFNKESAPFSSTLFHQLATPIKERIRDYKFREITEEQLGGNLPECNFIYVINLTVLTGLQQKALTGLPFQITTGSLQWQGKQYNGPVFLLYKTQHPRDSKKKCLYIIYNNPILEEKLLGFLNELSTNPLFYNDVIIYNDNNLFGVRNNHEKIF